MKLIVCFDLKYGVLFGHKRVSVDKEITNAIKEISSGEVLNVSEYSAPLFGNENVKIVANVDEVKEGFFFAEDFITEVDFRRFEEVYTYRWGVEYPSSIKLSEAQIEALNEMELVEERIIKGNSHNKVKFQRRINHNVLKEPEPTIEKEKISILAKIKNLFGGR